MKTFIASAVVALGLLSTALSVAQAASYSDYPAWARNAFEDTTH